MEVRRSARPRVIKKKSDVIYFDDQKIELNEEERDLIYPQYEKPREKRYCLCKRTEEEAAGLTMIECDSCHNWFHDECIGIPPQEMEQMERYYCPICSSKPIKHSKKYQPPAADIELLITALAEIDEEKPKIKKKETRLNLPKIYLFHFTEPVTFNKYIEVVGYIKNEINGDDTSMVIPITKEDLSRGYVWTYWGNYKIAYSSDGRLQANSDHRSLTGGIEEKIESAVPSNTLSIQAFSNHVLFNIGELEPLDVPCKPLGFKFDPDQSKRISEAMSSYNFEKMRETFNKNSKYKPCGVIKIPNN
jgi:PHD-finger